MDLGIEGKVALVTGGSKGLGRGCALALSREGVKVVLCARGEDALHATADELPSDSLPIAADVTDPASPGMLVAAAVERFGGLDILVGNSGGPPQARALDVEEDAFHAALNANLLTSIRLVQEAVPHMRAAGWGRIALITSWVIKQPIADLAYSNASRTGLWAWAKTAARDLVDDGITLNLLCPGPHETDRMKELGVTGRMGDPEDFGRVAAFLCSEAAGFLSGAAVSVDGAGTLGLV